MGYKRKGAIHSAKMGAFRGVTTLVIETNRCPYEVVEDQKTIVDPISGAITKIPPRVHFSYQLAYPILFSEPHLIKLSSWTVTNAGTSKFRLSADFMAQQYVNGDPEQFVGICASTAKNDYLPLAEDCIPAHGILSFTPLEPKKQEVKLVKSSVQGILVFHIVPSSCYHAS